MCNTFSLKKENAYVVLCLILGILVAMTCVPSAIHAWGPGERCGPGFGQDIGPNPGLGPGFMQGRGMHRPRQSRSALQSEWLSREGNYPRKKRLFFQTPVP